MRTAPPVHIVGQLDPWWYGGWRLISAVALGTTLVWCALFWPQDSYAERLARACAPLATALCAAAGLRAVGRPRRWRLDWDGQQWWLDAAGSPPQRASTPVAGNLRATIDLGPWLLLRFTPSTATDRWHGPTPAWLSLHRGAHSAQWHALRCAVYSPRPTLEPPPTQVGGRSP